MTLSRRALLRAFTLVGFGAMAGATEPALRDVAHAASLRFGSAMRAASIGDSAIAELVAAQCATLTPELEMKWAALSPAPGEPDWRGADALASWAATHGLRLRGHTLLWHRSMPAWLGAAPAWTVAQSHIGAVVRRYTGVVDEWDVVNEPITADGPRPSPFGQDYVRRALVAAHEAAPAARLMLNEYDLEYDLPDQAARRTALLSLVRSLRGAPLHGIGIQAHLAIGRPFRPAPLRDFLMAVADHGLSIGITELDVKERDLTLPPDQRDGIVADHVARVLEVALAQPAVRSLSCWGLSDRQSWLAVTPQDRARFPGAWQDGSSPGLNRGLPFDSDCRSKPMAGALTGAMRGRQQRL